MGSQTPTLKLPYPVGTDRVQDGDDAIQALAERIEARMPYGVLAYVQSIVQFAVTAPVTLLTLPAITVPAGRRIRVTARASGYTGAAALTFAEVTIAEGAALLSRHYQTVGASSSFALTATAILTPAAGEHTYYMQVGATGGAGGTLWTVNGEASNPVFIVAEDVGPVSLA